MKLPKRNFAIELDSNASRELYNRVMMTLEALGFTWKSGAKPTELDYYGDIDMYGQLYIECYMVSTKLPRFTFPIEPFKLTYNDERQKSKFPNLLTPEEFVQKYGIKDEDQIDLDDVFAKLYESKGEDYFESIGRELSKTPFAINFNGVSKEVYDAVFLLLEKLGFIWTSGAAPTDPRITNAYFKDLTKGTERYSWVGGQTVAHHPGVYRRVVVHRERMLKCNRGNLTVNDTENPTIGQSNEDWLKIHELIPANEFLNRYGIDEIDFDNLFDQLNESSSERLINSLSDIGMPDSFTIIIDDGERPGDSKLTLDLILPYLYALGCGWGVRHNKRAPRGFLEEIKSMQDTGIPLELQINYEDYEPMIISYKGDWHQDWSFSPQQFIKNYNIDSGGVFDDIKSAEDVLGMFDKLND